MRYWFDTEFHENGETIDLISIGMVAEDGRTYYAVSAEFNKAAAWDHAWLRENVLPWLPWKSITEAPGDYTDSDIVRGPRNWVEADPDFQTGLWKSRAQIERDLLAFCDPEQYGKPEFWAYYADYDWVALCQLFGRMIDLPKGWPMYCRDLKQEADRLENWIRWFNSDPEYTLKLPEQDPEIDGVEHHALSDAKWTRRAWTFAAEQAGDDLQGSRGSLTDTMRAMTIDRV